MVNIAVSCLTHFPFEAIILTPGDKRNTPPRPEIYPQNLSTEYLVVWGSKNNKGGVGLFKFHKKRNFFNLIKNKTFLFPSIWPSKEYTWALICPPSPQAE